ncbi:Ig-like domain-containing protein, partial [Secundilactobacillus collinoides]|uniref:Ig-like domain-containing protein n=1 Tax=Secundilactobacillus collinoides TaxID=33960 RepID=UPI000704D020
MGKGSKNLSKNNRQLATINDNEKLHYRMYKSGKTWLFAGIATFSLGLVFLGAPNVHADTTSETTQTTATTSSTSTTDTTTATETPAAEATTGSTTGGQTSSTSTSEDTDGVTAADDATATKTAAEQSSTAENAATTQESAEATTQTGATTTKNVTATTSDDKTLVNPTQDEIQQAKEQAIADGTNEVSAVAADSTVATDQGEVDKSSTTISADETVAKDPALDNGDTSGNQTVDSGTTTDPDTSDAVVKNSFGPSAGTADNSATAGLGEVDDNDQLPAVTQANADTDREAGEYGSIPVTATSNDDLDENIIVDKQSTSTTAEDAINDQGAISSDSTDLQQRGTIIYANGQNKLISISSGGSNEHGSVISLPSNISDTATVGTFKVITKNPVGLTIQDVDTQEEFQITDPDIAAKYALGDEITGMAVVDTNFNGSGMELVTTPVTTVIDGISDLFEGAGATALEALKTAVSAAALVPFAPTDAINAYSQGIDEEIAEIESMIDSGQNLMQNGITQTTLEEATKNADGSYSVMSSDGVATAIGDMVNSYIQGWTTGISDGILVAIGAKDNADGTNALDNLGIAGAAIKTAANIFASTITNAINSLSSAATTNISDAITKAIDGGVGVSQTVALPIEYTDPDLSTNTPGAFTGETIKTATKLYNTTTASNTTIVYQNVDKTQLNAAIEAASPSDSALAAAKAVAANVNASQKDVDDAYLALDPQGSLNVTISGETQVVGHVAATPIVGTTGQTAQEALDANNDKAFTTDVDGLTVSLTSADFDYSDAETDENGNSVTTYALNESGQDKVKAAVADLGSDYSVTNLDKVSSTITIPEADTPEITDPEITGNPTDGYDFTGKTDPNTPVTLTDPDGNDLGTGTSDANGDFTIPITGDVTPGETVTATPENGTPATATVPEDTTTPTDTDTPEITDPEVTGNSTDGYDFTGKTDPNTPVTITDNNGDPIATGTSDDKGNIDITIDPGTVDPGETVTATPENGTPATATVPEDTTTPTDTDTPEITDPEVTGNSTDGYHFTGTTDPNTPVTITDNNGDPIATGTSDDKGNIDITIDPGTVDPGDTVTATPENGDPVDATIPSDPT